MNSESTLHELSLSEREGALAAAVLEIVRHKAQEDPEAATHTARFALFHTVELLTHQPQLARLIPKEVLAQARGDHYHLTSIELPVTHRDLGKELHQAQWPTDATGGIVCGTIRAMNEQGPTDTSGSPIFVAVGATVDADSMCAVKPSATEPLRVGRLLIPELVRTLHASLGSEAPHP